MAFRKCAMLAGLADEEQDMQKGEELWANEFCGPVNGSYIAYYGMYRPRKRTQFSPKKPKNKSSSPPATNIQKWVAYVEKRSVGDRKLSEEPQWC